MVDNTTQDVYAKEWQVYQRSDILPPESRLLELHKRNWAQVRLLDVGVGVGRTTWVFASIVQAYTGMDLVPEMIEICRKGFGETPTKKFSVGNANDLSVFPDSSFDVVLFSYNGIDHLSHEDRLVFFREARRVLCPEGILFFSSHNLGVFPHDAIKSWHPSRNPFRWLRELKHIRQEVAFFKKANALALSSEAKEKGWAILPDVSHGGAFSLYYVHPEQQVKQLHECGFEIRNVWDNAGHEITDVRTRNLSWWISYHCQKV
jgi:ubiquinone/menaquinone biosynthesis C-methylase UbiE